MRALNGMVKMLKSMLEMAMVQVVVGGTREDEGRRWSYYVGGLLRLETEARNGLPHGKFTFFYCDGLKAIQGHFENGDRVGDSTYYLPGGVPLPDVQRSQWAESPLQ